jgi:hypothetical protein
MATAYEIAKAGGRHRGLIRRFSNEREAAIRKSIRSLENMIREHQDKIDHPMDYVSPDISPVHLQDLVDHYWPEEIENFGQQIEVPKGLLEDRENG